MPASASRCPVVLLVLTACLLASCGTATRERRSAADAQAERLARFDELVESRPKLDEEQGSDLSRRWALLALADLHRGGSAIERAWLARLLLDVPAAEQVYAAALACSEESPAPRCPESDARGRIRVDARCVRVPVNTLRDCGIDVRGPGRRAELGPPGLARCFARSTFLDAVERVVLARAIERHGDQVARGTWIVEGPGPLRLDLVRGSALGNGEPPEGAVVRLCALPSEDGRFISLSVDVHAALPARSEDGHVTWGVGSILGHAFTCPHDAAQLLEFTSPDVGVWPEGQVLVLVLEISLQGT